MTREHVVRLTILTACIFGFSIYMQKDTWIFPFPLYEVSMLAAIVLLYIADRKMPDLIGFTAIGWAVFQLIASDFILEFFLTERNFQWFEESFFIDYLLLGFALVFLVWGLFVSWQWKNLSLRVTGMLMVTGFVGCFIFNSYLIAIAPLVAWLACFYADNKEASIHRNIVFLFTFFFLSKHLTLALMVE
jgi:hypothetical protein